MKNKSNKRFTPIMILIFTAFTAVTAVAMTTGIIKFSAQKDQNKVVRSLPIAEPVVNKELLKQYAQLLSSIDPARKEYLQMGSVKVLQEKDSTIISPEMSFVVARKNNDCYYRLGTIETYNLNGIYVQINYHTKKVVVSKQKQMGGASFDLAKFPKKFKEEGYTLSSVAKGNKRQIKLLNPSHLVYKEYALSYDTVSNQVTEIFTKTANETRPESQGQGRLIYVSFSKVANQADLKKYDPFQVVKQNDGQWQLQPRFKSYELIAM